jgi:hypothetical protein
MNQSTNLYAIYSYRMGAEANYYLSYVFDEDGPINNDDLKDVYEQYSVFSEESNDYVGPFNDLTKLNQFAFHLCERQDAHNITLISLDIYNSLIESCGTTKDFLDKLSEEGNTLENIDKRDKFSAIKNLFN